MKTMQTIDQIMTEAPVETPNTSPAQRANNDTTPRPSGRPRVVVVGAGFGGLHVAAKLARADVDVLVRATLRLPAHTRAKCGQQQQCGNNCARGKYSGGAHGS